ncbi:TPA_exp: Uncharacterized protein A8136_1958 [Trichophyton benhamiae CBS 112371]|uniref:Heat shock protein 30 n=1 Tax=Trichophyton verrucosum (strain HKI 0517) TaxID=663202 RepID=D4D9E7_TRIVH|nr:uncharacterized protein TRV_03738 [Trichophyton verrucosum HKI 0517]EFE41517.1 hypothetical protein TRV_03738 [Trichophyton verrucosum HKI 0517]DAA75207.1 TPA_exp: Uncharacterized protein A8136_1958 [Trichophyton benhamiae CBS 112371]
MSQSSNVITTLADNADISISDEGTIWYWVVTGIFSLSAVAFLVGSFVVRNPNVRLQYYLSALSSYILSMAYFAMGANLGWVAVEVEFRRVGQFVVIDNGTENPTRQVFWIRYAGWLLATPLLMTQLLLLIKAPLKLILHEVFMVSIVMMTGLGAALIPNAYKWAYFVYGFFACAALGWTMLKSGYNHVRATTPSLKRVYLMFCIAVSIIFLLYGLAWGMNEGGNFMSPTGEAVFYGILDIWGGPLYCVFLLWAAHRYYRTEMLQLPI